MRNAEGTDHTADEGSEAPDDPLVQVGRVGKPHGLDGTVKVIPISDDPERFASFDTVHVGRSATEASPRTVTNVRFQPHKSGTTVLLTLEAITDRNEAEALRRFDVFVPESVIALEDEEHFVHDLIGWSVCLDSGETVGTLKAIMPLPGADALVIETTEGHEALVPFVEAYVPRIDGDAQRIYLNPIEGLLDANVPDPDDPKPPSPPATS